MSRSDAHGEQSCASCVYFQDGRGWTNHTCRRYPTSTFALGGRAPSVNRHDWCGEYERLLRLRPIDHTTEPFVRRLEAQIALKNAYTLLKIISAIVGAGVAVTVVAALL